MILWIVIFLLAAFALAAIVGAPYVPLLRAQIKPMLDALDLKPGQSLIDLGCGDGRLLKAAAKQGIKGIGYEINPWLYLVAQINCFKYRRIVRVHLANYWQADLPPADAVFVFLIGRYMGKLDRYLSARLKRPTRVVSYVFEIPERKAKVRGSNFFVYQYP